MSSKTDPYLTHLSDPTQYAKILRKNGIGYDDMHKLTGKRLIEIGMYGSKESSKGSSKDSSQAKSCGKTESVMMTCTG